MIDTYEAGRRLEIEPDVWREPGELLPEAHTWMRLDSYLHTGYVKEVMVGDQIFREAVHTYVPEGQRERVLELVGLTNHTDLDGPHKTPVRRHSPVRLKDIEDTGDFVSPVGASALAPSARRGVAVYAQAHEAAEATDFVHPSIPYQAAEETAPRVTGEPGIATTPGAGDREPADRPRHPDSGRAISAKKPAAQKPAITKAPAKKAVAKKTSRRGEK